MLTIALLAAACGKQQSDPNVGSEQDSVWDGSVATAFESGDGSENNPFIIKTPSQLAFLAQQVNAGNSYEDCHFEIVSDMNLAGHNWTPIGTSYRCKFSGSLDGKGHKILGLKVDSDVKFAGLFGNVRGFVGFEMSVIKNIVIPDAEIRALSAVCGILCGFATYASVSGCEVSGSVETKFGAGGLVGGASRVEIRDCVSEVHVTGLNVGGLSCGAEYSTIEDCAVRNSKLTSTDREGSVGGAAGGLAAGIDRKSDFSRCRCEVEIRCGRYAGGLFGMFALGATGSKVTDCIAVGSILDPSTGGGFVGYVHNGNISFENCGFDGTLEGYKNLGTIIGTDDSGKLTFSGCWYDGTKTGVLPKVGKPKGGAADYSGISDTKPSGV